jgi:hypothetical protein
MHQRDACSLRIMCIILYKISPPLRSKPLGVPWEQRGPSDVTELQVEHDDTLEAWACQRIRNIHGTARRL